MRKEIYVLVIVVNVCKEVDVIVMLRVRECIMLNAC